jgi:hypothetical protein
MIKTATRSVWSATNPTLLAGEFGRESDTGNLKIGDGKLAWNRLPYHGCPGYWGSFWDSTSQTATANTATSIYLRSSDAASYGIRVASQTRITFDYPGVYSITFSIQFSNSDSQIHDINVWLRKNDSGSTGDIAASDSRFSIISSHGGGNGSVIGTVNYVLPVVANDYIELIWSTSNAAAFILAEAAGTSPVTHPSIPGIICTVTQVAAA